MAGTKVLEGGLHTWESLRRNGDEDLPRERMVVPCFAVSRGLNKGTSDRSFPRNDFNREVTLRRPLDDRRSGTLLEGNLLSVAIDHGHSRCPCGISGLEESTICGNRVSRREMRGCGLYV